MSEGETVIAIADDDPRLLESLADLLRSAGYSVRPYSSAIALLEDASIEQIDFLITDIGMPVMDGVELHLRARARKPDLPVIFITGRQELATQRRVVEAVGTKVFEKPFDSQALLAAVSDALARGDSGVGQSR